jgi:hypothetical protein
MSDPIEVAVEEASVIGPDPGSRVASAADGRRAHWTEHLVAGYRYM